MANVWVESLGLWVDDQTGNTYDLDEGFWRSPNRDQVFGGIYGETWVPAPGGMSARSAAVNGPQILQALQAQSNPVAQGFQAGTAGTAGSAYGVIPGYGWEVDARAQAADRLLADINNRADIDIANINAAASARAAQIAADASLSATEKSIAQSEAEFARRIALDRVIADRDYEVQKAQLELDRLREARAERESAAKMAANPSDFVAYEYYKRNLQNQQGGSSPTGMQGTGGAGATSLNAMTQAQQQAYGLNLTPYDDSTLQNIAANLFNPGSLEYNPRIKGQGAFGSAIESPNTLTRNEAFNLSDTEKQILGSYLKAGINIGGQQVALDPEDYFQQAENSWVPTLAGAGQGTQYR